VTKVNLVWSRPPPPEELCLYLLSSVPVGVVLIAYVVDYSEILNHSYSVFLVSCLESIFFLIGEFYGGYVSLGLFLPYVIGFWGGFLVHCGIWDFLGLAMALPALLCSMTNLLNLNLNALDSIKIAEGVLLGLSCVMLCYPLVMKFGRRHLPDL